MNSTECHIFGLGVALHEINQSGEGNQKEVKVSLEEIGVVSDAVLGTGELAIPIVLIVLVVYFLVAPLDEENSLFQKSDFVGHLHFEVPSVLSNAVGYLKELVQVLNENDIVPSDEGPVLGQHIPTELLFKNDVLLDDVEVLLFVQVAKVAVHSLFEGENTLLLGFQRGQKVEEFLDINFSHLVDQLVAVLLFEVVVEHGHL